MDLREKLFSQDSNEATFQPGSRLDIPERTKEKADELTPKGRDVRTNIDRRLKDSAVNPANENISTGTFVGAVGTLIVWTLEDYLPGQVVAQADVVGVEPVDQGLKYTVDANAMIESQSRFRAILDSGTGVTSLWTDEIDVESVELIKSRPARDTYRYEIVVRD